MFFPKLYQSLRQKEDSSAWFFFGMMKALCCNGTKTLQLMPHGKVHQGSGVETISSLLNQNYGYWTV